MTMSVDLTADKILNLRAGDVSHQAIRYLLKQWHPDKSEDPKASDVFQHLIAIRDAKDGANTIVVQGRSGDQIIAVSPHAETDVGRRWVGSKLFGLSFEKEPDLSDVFWNNLRDLPRGSGELKKQIRVSVPHSGQRVEHKGADMIIIPRKERALLADWIPVHGNIPPVHAAWIGSGLLNMACFAEWAGWCFPGISLESVSINPERHAVGLIFGWEAACPLKQRPKIASRRTLSLCPSLKVSGRFPPPTLTLDVVRLTVREALGDVSGMKLLEMGVPKPMTDWLNAPSASSAVEDYERWHKSLETAFGARKFVEWEKSVKEVYPII